MANATPTQLPAFIQLRYDENGVFDRFKSDADKATSSVAKVFDGAFSEVTRIARDAAKNTGSAFGGLDLGIDKMREQAAQANLNKEALIQLGRAAQLMANETGDASAATKAYVASITEQIAVADRVARAANEQLATYSQLQNTVDGLTASNSRLAAAQREVLELQGRAGAVPANALPTNTATGVDALVGGQASLDRAAASGATLESVLGRVSVKSAEVVQALAAKQAAEQASAAASNEAAAAAQREAESFQAQAQNLQLLAAIEEAEAQSKREATDATNLAIAQNAEFVDALRRAQKASADAAIADAQLAKEKQTLASAVDRLNAELDPAAAAAMGLARDIKILDDALAAGAIDAERYAKMIALVNEAERDGTNARRNVINSQRAMNTAMLQSGQQMQDFAIQVYSGQSAAIAAAQQLPQLAFALSGLEKSSNKTQASIGKFATFLSGPWGLAVGVAVGVLGTLIYKLIASADASDEAAEAARRHTGELDFQRQSTEELTKAINESLAAQRQSIQLSYQQAEAAQEVAQKNLDAAISERERTKALLDGYRVSESRNAGQGTGGVAGSAAGILAASTEADLAAQDANIASLEELKRLADIPVLRRQAAAATDEAVAATIRYEQAERQYTEAYYEGYISKEYLTSKLIELEKKRDKETNATKNAKAADREARKAEKERERAAAKAQRDQERAAKAVQKLADYGEKAEQKVTGINDQFDAAPSFIDKAAKAMRDLDGIAANLTERLSDPNLSKEAAEQYKKTIAEAQQARETVEESLVRPIQDMREESEKNLAVQELLAQGREDDAAALQAIYSIEQKLGSEAELREKIEKMIATGHEDDAKILQSILDMYPDIKSEVADIAVAEAERTRELERQSALFQAQIDYLDTVKSSLTSVLQGRSTDLFGNITQALKDLQGKRLFDSIFGDLFQNLENELRGQSPLGKESQRLADEMHTATTATTDLAASFKEGAAAIRQAVGLTPTGESTSTAFNTAFADLSASNDNTASSSDEILVTAKSPIEIKQSSIMEFADKTAAAMVTPFQEVLNDVLGTKFGNQLSGVLQSGLSGYLTGGITGAVTNSLKGIVDQTGILGGSTGGLSSVLGGATSGAATGTQISGIANALGINMSTTGSQIGGAIGSFVQIPGAQVIGSVIGGLLGGLFSSAKWGTTAITGNDSSDTTTSGNKGSYESNSSSAASSVQSGLASIAEQLGADIGDYAVSIGQYKGKWRVNTNGITGKLGGYKNSATYNFGDDSEAAIEFAIADAISDGALLGLRASTQAILAAGDDLEEQLEKAVTWEDAFSELESILDPLGYALSELNDEFEELLEIAEEAGATSEELAQLEELYNIKRAEAVEDANEEILGSLQDLLDDLTTGDNGLSLSDRQAAALATYEELKALVEAGDTTAYDDYVTAAQNLLEIEQELYGSQQEYFDRLYEVIDLASDTIAAQTTALDVASDENESPFDTSDVTSAIEEQTDTTASLLEAVVNNLGTVIELLAESGYTVTSSNSVSFSSSY